MLSTTLFGNSYRATALYDYKEELTLLKALINKVSDAVYCQESMKEIDLDTISYIFARSIVDYAKSAYDNIVLGHFNSAFMIIRTIIENTACLDAIIKYNDKGV